MSRVRFLYAKRGLSAFVPHVELPPLFARSARRAGLPVLLTEGFSPHPKISLGPALPVGVPALAEPAEIWVGNWGERALEDWQKGMPPGFTLLRASIVEGPSLSRLCKAAEYRVFFRSAFPGEGALRLAVESALQEPEILYAMDFDGESARIVLAQPDRFGPGFLVKAFRASDLVEGWKDLLILRTAIGGWDLNTVKSLV